MQAVPRQQPAENRWRASAGIAPRVALIKDELPILTRATRACNLRCLSRGPGLDLVTPRAGQIAVRFHLYQNTHCR